jgi:hypothetical protein
MSDLLGETGSQVAAGVTPCRSRSDDKWDPYAAQTFIPLEKTVGCSARAKLLLSACNGMLPT